jgi:hypothetical protein
MKKIILACGAWGNIFIKNYIDYIYPNHMACLKQIDEDFDGKVDYEYCFYTDSEDMHKATLTPTVESVIDYVDSSNIDYLARDYNMSDGDIHGRNEMISFPNQGVFKIDVELIYYTKGSPMIRGILGTVATNHSAGSRMVMQSSTKSTISNQLQLPNVKVISQPGGFQGYGLGVIQTLSMKQALSENASIFILSADCIYPVNTFSNILKLSETVDNNIFFIPPYRVTPDIVPHLKDRNYSSRNLVRLSMKCLHPKFVRHFMENYSTQYYTTFCWKFNDSGFLIRTFHMHPIFFRNPSVTYANYTIDQSTYLSKEFSRKDVYVITDSDIAATIDIDLDPARKVSDLTGYHLNPTKGEILPYCQGQMHSVLRELMKYKSYIHSEDLTDEWKITDSASDKFVIETFGGFVD